MRIPALERVGPVGVLGRRQEAHAEDAHAQHSSEEGKKRPCARSNGCSGAQRVRRVLLEPRHRPSDGLGFLHFNLQQPLGLILMQLLLGFRSQTHGACLLAPVTTQRVIAAALALLLILQLPELQICSPSMRRWIPMLDSRVLILPCTSSPQSPRHRLLSLKTVIPQMQSPQIDPISRQCRILHQTKTPQIYTHNPNLSSLDSSVLSLREGF